MPPETPSYVKGDVWFLSTLPAAFLSVPDRAKLRGREGTGITLIATDKQQGGFLRWKSF
jgi:hypothetical protein